MQKVTPFIWFEKGAKEAADYYVSVFGGDSKITNHTVMSETPSGTVEIVAMNLGGLNVTIMAAGPFQPINSAVSFVIDCADQAEVDHYWAALSASPSDEQCGWCKDKYGVVWQVVPRALNTLMSDPDRTKAMRVQQAMLKMKKIVVADLEAAYNQ